MTLNETLVMLNNDYSGLLAAFIALITALITLAYVLLTYNQVKLSKLSVKSVEKQIRLNNQPCIIPKVIDTIGTECFTETRRQLVIEIELNNVGNSPAINIYTIGYFLLQHSMNQDSKKVNMFFLPDYVPILSVQEKTKSSISFETKQIKLLVKDLEIGRNLNMERIRTNPHKAPYPSTNLVIKVYYKNLLGQWFEAILIKEIAWLNDTKLPEKNIPPNKLKKDTKFKLQLISDCFSPVDIKLVDEEVIKEITLLYEEHMPNFNKMVTESLNKVKF